MKLQEIKQMMGARIQTNSCREMFASALPKEADLKANVDVTMSKRETASSGRHV
jgi:hypothetical protein